LSTPFRLLLPRSLHEEMLAQARAEQPNECCGLLAGKVEAGVGRVVRRFPLVNVLASPTEFESDGRSMFEATRAMQREGLDLLAIYHSHPTSAAVPSRKDLEQNYWPGVVNFIISLAGKEPDVCGWWLHENKASEAEWQLVQ
jgi:proteasome lid subunit RPN8/RPN11